MIQYNRNTSQFSSSVTKTKTIISYLKTELSLTYLVKIWLENFQNIENDLHKMHDIYLLQETLEQK